jgi:HD-GYP domain-containing protein (c-di-GMP phosphodiesterase class II)
MILGKDLYDNKRSLLLSKGHILTQKEIDRISLFKYQGIYITDKIFDEEDIEPKENVSEVLRLNAVQAVKDIFTGVKTPKDKISKQMVSRVKDSVNDIVNEIVSAKSATYIMTDLKLYDDYTYYHSANVAIISIVLGLSMGLNNTNLYKLGMGALLHDIGKMFVPKSILEKKGRLTPDEFK